MFQIRTFIVQKGLESPPKRLAFSIADRKRASEPENFSVDAEAKNLSAVIYDDFQGFVSSTIYASELKDISFERGKI